MTDQTFETDFSSVQIPRFPAVYTVKQTLTDEQKAQARENIGAVDTTTAENLQKDAAAAQSTADAAQKDAAAAQSAADAAQKDAAAAQSTADAAQKDAAAAQSTADAAQKDAAAAQSTADAAQKDATAAQSAADAAQKDATAAQAMAEKGVSFHPQTLTDEQKAQARKNIGAAAPGEGGGGGGGAQADWNAAEGALGHILNKPFGIVSAWVLPETTAVTEEMGEGMSGAEFVSSGTPVDGEVYTVMWNGVAYQTTAIGMDGEFAMGNIGLLQGGESTGEPFVVVFAEEFILAIPIDGSTTVTMSIRGPVLRKIDGEFLPAVPRLDLYELGIGDVVNDTILTIPLTDYMEDVIRQALRTGVIYIYLSLHASKIGAFSESKIATISGGTEWFAFTVSDNFPYVRMTSVYDNLIISAGTSYDDSNNLIFRISARQLALA